jgi:AcrR family transcriptional regulator
MIYSQEAVQPRKTPRQARSAATVDAILDAAARVLIADGLAGLNTNAVARVAGVSIGSLYQYFPTKEAILLELLRRKRSRVLADIEAALEGMESLPEDRMIARLVAAAMRSQARTPELSQAFDYASAALPMHAETIRVNAEIVAHIARFLSLRGTLLAATVAQDIVGISRGMMLQASQTGPIDEAALAERICAAIAGYLAEWRSRHDAVPNKNGGPRPAIS